MEPAKTEHKLQKSILSKIERFYLETYFNNRATTPTIWLILRTNSRRLLRWLKVLCILLPIAIVVVDPDAKINLRAALLCGGVAMYLTFLANTLRLAHLGVPHWKIHQRYFDWDRVAADLQADRGKNSPVEEG